MPGIGLSRRTTQGESGPDDFAALEARSGNGAAPFDHALITLRRESRGALHGRRCAPMSMEATPMQFFLDLKARYRYLARVFGVPDGADCGPAAPHPPPTH